MKITLREIESSYKTKEDTVGLNPEMMSLIMPIVSPQGLFMDFGVWHGYSIRQIVGAMEKHGIIQTVYGFDSFLGLPESWGDLPVGSFNAGGHPPDIQDNRITLITGWFNEALPGFLLNHPGPVSFAHIDCDIYSSAKYVLDQLKDRIIPGTVLLFDEMINVKDYEIHEFKAFNEFLEENDREAELMCHGKYQVAFKIK